MIQLHEQIGLLTDDDRLEAEDLINRRYDWRGYGDDHQLPDRNAYSFGITRAGKMIGTVTLRTPPLAAEQLFAEEIGSRAGLFPVELTKLAFEEDGPSLEEMAALYHCVFIFGKDRLDATDLLIEVNPRHVRFYERMLGFKKLGAVKQNPSVSAPSQLLFLRIHEISGKIFEPGRSLYRHFLSPELAHEVKLRCDSIPSR